MSIGETNQRQVKAAGTEKMGKERNVPQAPSYSPYLLSQMPQALCDPRQRMKRLPNNLNPCLALAAHPSPGVGIPEFQALVSLSRG